MGVHLQRSHVKQVTVAREGERLGEAEGMPAGVEERLAGEEERFVGEVEKMLYKACQSVLIFDYEGLFTCLVSRRCVMIISTINKH